MRAHTPGPWEIEYEDELGNPLDDGLTIESGDGPVAFRVIDCSAHLIAAAPDLLAACQAVAADLEQLLNGDDFSGMSDEELFAGFLRVLRPAIAKAEGRVP